EPQRLGYRFDGAEIGARADDDLTVGGAKGPDGLFEVTDGKGLVDAVRHVVGTDQDERDIGVVDLFQHLGELIVQAGGLRADDRDVGQLDRSPAQRRDAVGDDGANRL